jgi:hypothetical protein
MKLYNAIVYWNYGVVTKYQNIRYPDKFIEHFNKSGEHSAIVKVFFYVKYSRKGLAGTYCGYYFPNKGLNIWR